MFSFTLRLAAICLVGIAISGSSASAWWADLRTTQDAPPKSESADKAKTVDPPKEQPKADERPKALDKAKPEDKPKALDKAKPGERLRPKAKQKVTPDGKGRSATDRGATPPKRKTKAKLKMNPNAQWACDQKTATLEPVWRGGQTLTFPFVIRNEGTADLQIRAKGG